MVFQRFFLSLATIGLVASATVGVAGPIAGIVRVDGQPLETGPFVSQFSPTGPAIAHEFQPMYLTSSPNTWPKTFVWNYAGGSISPGDTLCIMESIPLIYPPSTPPSAKLRIADWHESILSVSNPYYNDFFKWDTMNPNTGIGAHIGSAGFPINGQVSFSADGKTIWFDFDPITIPMDMGPASTPVTLEIAKYIKYTGPNVITSGGQGQPDFFSFVVSEYPTTPEPSTVVLALVGAGVLGFVGYRRSCCSKKSSRC
jgi:hypothetical protein